ncbi:MAG: TatD family hydrolase [Phycisphaerales bacterium]|nr:TatD family hydrolase [Phycisphaerales bacterium]
MIDTHCHLTFADYAGRIDQVIDEAAELGVTGAISIATTTQDSHDTLRLAREHDRVWCTAGVHPLYADKGPHDWSVLKQHAKHPKCVAFGELGLDNHYDHPPKDIQHTVLAEQLATIESCWDNGDALPIVIHCRKAFTDLLPILRSTKLDPDRFVFHCFTGTPDEARMVLDFGASISFTGVVTYSNAKEVAQAAKLVPSSRIMVETDAPFLSPDPMRGKRPCMPGYARYTAEFLAKIRGVSFAEFHQHIDENTHRFFGITAPSPDPQLLESIL